MATSVAGQARRAAFRVDFVGYSRLGGLDSFLTRNPCEAQESNNHILWFPPLFGHKFTSTNMSYMCEDMLPRTPRMTSATKACFGAGKVVRDHLI